MHNVLYAPDCKVNLISIGALTRDLGCTVSFTEHQCKAHVDQVELFTLKFKTPGVYTLHATTLSQLNDSPVACLPAGTVHGSDSKKASAQLWHRRLGHPGTTQLSKLVNRNLLTDLELPASSLCLLGVPCEACALGKAHRTPFPLSRTVSSAPLEVVHSDLMGPFTPLGLRGERYVATLVDDFSGLGEVFPIHRKSDTFTVLTTALTRWSSLKLGLPIKILRTDRGGGGGE